MRNDQAWPMTDNHIDAETEAQVLERHAHKIVPVVRQALVLPVVTVIGLLVLIGLGKVPYGAGLALVSAIVIGHLGASAANGTGPKL